MRSRKSKSMSKPGYGRSGSRIESGLCLSRSKMPNIELTRSIAPSVPVRKKFSAEACCPESSSKETAMREASHIATSGQQSHGSLLAPVFGSAFFWQHAVSRTYFIGTRCRNRRVASFQAAAIACRNARDTFISTRIGPSLTRSGCGSR